MPGPIPRLAASIGDSNDFSVFESCDDIQEAWGGLNGNYSQDSLYHECNTNAGLEYREARFNCLPTTPTSVKIKVAEYFSATTMAEARPLNNDAAGLRNMAEVRGTRATQADGYGEDIEIENEAAEETVETINLPVVSASLSVDLSTSLTRQKISSVQRGPTLTYVDQDEGEEPPTRRTRPLAHANESMDVGTPLHNLAARPTSTTSPEPGQESFSHKFAQRSLGVSRNPSYHSAVKDAAVQSLQNSPKSHPSDKNSRSCDSSPIRPTMKLQTEESSGEGASGGCGGWRHVSESDGLATLPLAPNMPRSVSFSGPELLSPAMATSCSLSEGNSRSGSVPQLSSVASHSSAPTLESKSAPTLESKSAPTLESRSPPPNFTRGSVISRSFRRLFSTPNRLPPTIHTEECWDDIPGGHNTSEAEARSSRLKRISSSFSRKLTTKPKTSASGTNGQHIVVPNGSTSPEDPGSLVEYEDLLKLFCCSGCQSFMVPPLHQCRKGHLVCNSCRFSLKQACPTCKQRFSESTNMMMEQVCQLVKFPCKYAPQGCPEFHRPRAKQDHEHFCSYRPVHCHHGPQGCPKVLLLRDMAQHLEQCDFKKK